MKNAMLREDVAEAQATVSELTEQLTNSFEAREQAVKTSVRYVPCIVFHPLAMGYLLTSTFISELARINTAAKMKYRAVGFLNSTGSVCR